MGGIGIRSGRAGGHATRPSVAAARHVFDLNCNRKIAMETHTEVYHVLSIHPKTVAPILDDRRDVDTLYRNGHGRMIAPRPASAGDVNAVLVRAPAPRTP